MTQNAITAAAIANRAKRIAQIQALQPVKKAAAARASELREELSRVKKAGEHGRFVRAQHWAPGFFPTPRPVVVRMIEAAELAPGMLCLEPSAGTGNIARAILAAGVAVADLDCVEFVQAMATKLFLEGFSTRPGDFLALEPWRLFDRVLMNPPFEKRQDEAHIRHACTFLKPGGRLVAVCASPTGDRLASIADVQPLPDDAFRQSERPTGVRTSLVVIDN